MSELIEKWETSGLLCGIPTESKQAMSQLLENQANMMLKERTSPPTFATIAFPVIRRIFGSSDFLKFTWNSTPTPSFELDGVKHYVITRNLKTRWMPFSALPPAASRLDAEVEQAIIFAEQLRTELNEMFEGKFVFIYTPVEPQKISGETDEWGLTIRYRIIEKEEI